MARKGWQTWVKRLFTLAFLILIPVLLFMLARNLDWNEVRQSLLATSPAPWPSALRWRCAAT